jgi:hypothetical protein
MRADREYSTTRDRQERTRDDHDRQSRHHQERHHQQRNRDRNQQEQEGDSGDLRHRINQNRDARSVIDARRHERQE